jgi:plastocyanin
VVAACGSNSSPSASGGSSSAAAPASTAAASSSGGGDYGGGGKYGGGGSSGAGGAASSSQIKIENFKFGAPLTVSPGATVEVENEDVASHDVVSDDGLFKTPTLAKGEKATFKAPTKPGTYKFSCSLHPATMSGIGTLTVKG